MGLRRTMGQALVKAGALMAGPWGGGGVVGTTRLSIGDAGFVQALTPPGGAPPRRRGEDYLRSFANMPWLHAVVHKVAFTCATIPWKLYVERDGDEPIEYLRPHPFRTLLNRGVRDPNGFQVLTGLQMRMLTHEYMELRGEAFWLLDRNIGGRGVPIQAWPCPPNWIVRAPTQDDPTFWLTMPHGMQAKIPPSEVVWFRDPDPYNPYTRGVGVAESVGEELSVDEFASKYVSRFFWNSARPDLIVSKTGLNEPGLRRFEEEWNRRNQGVWNAFRAYFLSGEADIKVIDRNFQQLQFIELRRWQRDLIFQSWGIPPEIMGNLEHANRATVEVADYVFSKFVIAPRLAMFDAMINGRLMPEYDTHLLLQHDDPVPENREAVIKEVNDPNAGQWLTQNERRKKIGLDPVIGGDMFLVPVNLSPMATLGSPPKPGEVSPDATTEPGQTLEDVPTEGPELPVGRGARPQMKQADGEPEPQRPSRTPVLDLAALGMILGDLIGAARIMHDRLAPIYRTVVEDHGDRALAVAGGTPPFETATDRVVQYLQTVAPQRVRGITETTWGALRETIAEGIQAGETIPQIADRISAVFAEAKGPRAALIARTETIQAATQGTLEGYRQSGVIEQKEWLSAEDDRVCPICQALDGEVVDLDAAFSDGEDGPPAHPDCRCALLPVVTEKAIAVEGDPRRIAMWRTWRAATEAHERMFARELKKSFQAQQSQIMDRLRGAAADRMARAGARVAVPA